MILEGYFFRKELFCLLEFHWVEQPPGTLRRFVTLSVSGDSFIAASKSHWICNLHIG